MSNSYTSPPALVDPARTTAGLTLRTTELSRLGDLQNYAFGVGGCGDVLNQYWDEDVYEINSTSYVIACEWRIPRPSNVHNELKVRLGAHTTTAGGSFRVGITFPTSSTKYTSSAVTITDSSRFGSAFEEATITVTGTETDLMVKLSLEVQAVSPGYVQLAFIQAAWTELSSPLSTGSLAQGSDNFIPQGISRLGADLPLTARFGVETLANITTLRKRGRTLFQWAGSQNARVGSTPAEGLGIFDPQVMFSNVALYGGMNQIDDLEVRVLLDVVNYSAGSFIDIFGHRLSITLGGLNEFSLKLRLNEINLSDDFGLSMYQVGLDDTPNNADLLLSLDNKLNTNPLYIRAISIIGV
jgi:hypothetical protein